MVDKAVPIVLRERCGVTEILVFDHPLAGRQLVKGTVEAGEEIEAAAVRELAEESGIVDVARTIYLGTQNYAGIKQRWHFVLCELKSPVGEDWAHYTEDGGGLVFRFLWQPIDQPIDNPDGHVFEQARLFMCQAVRN